MEVVESAGSDYRWRAFVDRKAFSALVSARIERISYTNFKNSVTDGDLHELYMRFWDLHRRYQEKDKSVQSSHEGRGRVSRMGNSKWTGKI
jgi:hypothetical protein